MHTIIQITAVINAATLIENEASEREKNYAKQ